ncbi:uncharacterized protein LOC108253315 [Diaphorina citri]|uniref:Uncharacterized protein LOC108253315 n=1 Tax=Diaphorina citri TaxID=121845 RepID=A0A1S4EK45_DIACI|nr:uncharacterized protein LOC108253315 [Diaphorina citri]KAI5693141.1 hypothetical protein M8J75_009261 [Diaphorina citri]KAI5709045.1 hypothetical protein M8J76_008833 [Diaphorina citri]
MKHTTQPVSIVFYLLSTLFITSTIAKYINWVEYPIDQAPQGFPVINLTKYDGIELCAANGTNTLCVTEFLTYIEHESKQSFRATCETDDIGDIALGIVPVCWLRQKVYDWKSASKKTGFQMQFYNADGACLVRYAGNC